MPSLPQGAFAACKLRAQNQKTLQVATNTPDKPEPMKAYNINKKAMDYTPVKYNEKFMNAIWGHYNRYSPHNIKSNDAAIATSTNTTFQKQEVCILMCFYFYIQTIFFSNFRFRSFSDILLAVKMCT